MSASTHSQSLIKPVLPSEEERFSANVVELSRLIHNIVLKAHQQGYGVVNPTLVEFASCMIGQFDKKTLIEGFIWYSHKHWPLIKEKNESFFINHAHVIFQDLPIPTSSVDAFKQLFTLKTPQGQPIVCKEDIEDLWDFFGTLVKICIKFIHHRRKPQAYRVDGGITYKYTVEHLPEVDVAQHATQWDLKLGFPLVEVGGGSGSGSWSGSGS